MATVITSVADVVNLALRTLGLVELYFSYVVSQRFFRERLSQRELAGFVLWALGLVFLTTHEIRRTIRRGIGDR